MNTQEIRKLISGASEPEWFNTQEINISYKNVEFSKTFTGISDFHKFLEQQTKGWEKYENLPPVLNESKTHFLNLRKQLETFVNSNISQAIAQLPNQWSNVRNSLQQDSNIFIYEAVETKFLVDLHKEHPSYVQGALNFLIGNPIANTRDEFSGAMLAFELKHSETKSKGRRDKEKKSIANILSNLRNQQSECETQLSEHLSSATKKYNDYVQQVDTFKKDKEGLFNDWYGKAKQTVTDLEETYEANLQLKKPAEYWLTQSKELRNQGWIAFGALFILVLGVSISLYVLMWHTPDKVLEALSGDNKFAAIRWSVIFITFISFLAFGIRAVTKVMFSSFHLARDCKERSTLTYFYLSLLKGDNFDASDRQLVMQSLFSRADTGLLKDDGGPTMPGELASRVISGK